MKILNKCDKNNMEWTVRKLKNNYASGVITFDNAVQRGYEWKVDRQSEFILSVILDKPIPPIYVTRNNGEEYSAIDGKQRSLTLIKFLNDEFELNGISTVEVEDDNGNVNDVDLNGLYYSDLDEIFQNAIQDAALSFVIINNPTDDQVCDYFYLLNNGKPLSAMTKTRVKAVSRETITKLGNHELFKNALTAKALARYTNEDIVVKAWAVLHQEEPSLETAKIRKVTENIKITNDDVIQLTNCFDRILEVHKMIEDKKIAKRILTRTHMISIMRVVNRSVDDGVSTTEFKRWFVTFFAGKKSATISSIYNSAAGAGSARKDAVMKRLIELDKSYDNYFFDRKENKGIA